MREGNRYDDALFYFRLAVRLNPYNKNYWSDLGVTEMRVRDYERAASRFFRGLDLDPTYKGIWDNLNELANFAKNIVGSNGTAQYPEIEYWDYGNKSNNRFYKSSNFVAFDRSQIQHKILDIRSLTSHEFFSIYSRLLSDDELLGDDARSILSKPFVLRGAPLKQVHQRPKYFNFWEFIENFANETVDYYPHSLREESSKPYFSTLKQAVTELLDPATFSPYLVDMSVSGTYIHWNLPHSKWADVLEHVGLSLKGSLLDSDSFWLDSCLESPKLRDEFNVKTHWKMVLVGEKGAQMFNHKDTLRSSSWQLQLQGTKQWALCSGDNDPYLYSAGDVDALSPNYKRHPLVRHASCYYVNVSAGDVIYYPKDYWHQTLNLDTPTVAISGTLADHNSYPFVRRELMNECDNKEESRLFVPEDRLCKALQSCYGLWEKQFAKYGQDSDARTDL